MYLLRRIAAGLKRRPGAAIVDAGLLYSVVWTSVESADFFVAGILPRGRGWWLALIMASACFGILRVAGPSRIAFTVRNTTTRVRIEFGDLFGAAAPVRVIPANEYFDTELGELVSPASLHGQFITRVLGGHSDAIHRSVADQLASDTIERVARPRGKVERFPLGAAITVPTADSDYVLFALSRTDTTTNKAYADVPDLYRALTGLWQYIRTAGNGRRVAVPLVGGGLSGVGLPPNQLLYLIMMSLVEESKRAAVGSEIIVVVHVSYLEAVDLHLIHREWA